MQQGGPLGFLMYGVLALVSVGIVAAIGSLVIGQVGTSFTANSSAANATTAAQTGITNTTIFYGVIGTVIAAIVILGLVSLFTGGKK
jgi:Flp pilus assembly pilin Flp